MSLLKANSVQIGQSATATNNFTLAVPSSPDGTIKLARGNSGSTTADIFSVNASGNSTFNEVAASSVNLTSSNLSGYGSGSGGTVTQATNKTTGVTINKPCGKITTHNASLNSGAVATFLVSNSLLSSNNDVVVITFDSSLASVDSNYSIRTSVGVGGFWCSLKNESGGTLSQAVPFNFCIIKVSTS